MSLHGAQLCYLAPMVQEHSPHYLTQYFLGGTGNASIVEQVALLVFRLCEHSVRQPAHQQILVEAALRLQEFYAAQHTAELILPAASSRQQLLQD